MAIVRICALFSLCALGAYHLARALAAQCVGARCDNYLFATLLLPLTLALAVATGLLAIAAARRCGQGRWLGLLIGSTLVTGLGSLASLYVFRDSPDTFVAIVTALLVLLPLLALLHSFSSAGPAPRAAP